MTGRLAASTRTLAAILALSLCLKLGVWWHVAASDPALFVTSDSHAYHHSARALQELGAFSVSPERPDLPQTVRTPGYPAFLAAVYAVFGQRPAAGVAVQIFLSLVSIAIVYRLAAERWRPSVGRLAALLMAIDLASFSHALLLLTETLFTLLICCLLWCAGRFDAGESWRKWAPLLGLSLALATLVRPISYYLAAPLLIWVVIVAWRRQRSFKVTAAGALLFVLPFGLLVGGWQLRNQLRTGSADFAGIAGADLLFFRGAAVVAARDGISLEEARRRLGEDRYRELHPETRGWSDAQLSSRWQREGLELMLRHPRQTAEIHGRGVVAILLATGEHTLMRLLEIPIPETGPLGDLLRLSPVAYLERWVVGRTFSWLIFSLALGFLALLYLGTGGWALSSVRRRRIGLLDLCFWGIFCYLVLLPSGPQANHRFRVPVTPILCLYGAAGLQALAGGLGRRLARHRDHRQAVPGQQAVDQPPQPDQGIVGLELELGHHLAAQDLAVQEPTDHADTVEAEGLLDLEAGGAKI